MGRIFFKVLVGGATGILVWALIEPSAPGALRGGQWTAFELRLILLLGLAVGGGLGAVDGWRQGSRLHLLRGAGLGAFLGALGAGIGYTVGGLMVAATFGPGVFESGPIALRTPARMMVLTPLGVMIGLGIGAATLNLKRAALSGLGGALGGLTAGALFDIVSGSLAQIMIAARGLEGASAEVGQPGRAAMCLLIGAGIGLFIGFLEEVAKSAWLVLRLGRNEGKQWIVDKAQTVLGRNEFADVPLFGDPAIAPNHATIVRQNQVYWIFDGGSGVLVNGNRVAHSPLCHGDRITLGSTTLEFQMRTGSAPARAAEALRSQTGGVPISAPQVARVSAPIPTAAKSSIALVALNGPIAGQRFVVQSRLEIGREAPDLRLGFDSMASRRHAAVTPDANGVAVSDLGSTNGTFVNDQRITETIARVGDVLKVGATSFRVELAT